MVSNASYEQTAAHLFRQESGKMLAVLTKLFGLQQSEIAEDILQETLIAALETWKIKGVPDNPRAWLYQVAKNKTLDYLRREKNFRDNVSPNYVAQSDGPQRNGAWLDTFFSEQEIQDAQLRMMFAACHPAIPADSQLVLVLKTLCGLSTTEIAGALLLSEDTLGKRIYRAKEKIRQEKLKLEVPSGVDLSTRLDAVLQAIYLLFNEGYKASSAQEVIRVELCAEAMRLCQLLSEHPASALPKTQALMALMCFNTSRFPARLDENGNIVTLEKQNRRLWDQNLIGSGYHYLKQSSVGDSYSEYHLEAAIASYHASALDFTSTNWQGIYYCYQLLVQIDPSPFVALNRAVALGYAENPSAGLKALQQIKGLEKNAHFHAALGEIYKRLGHLEQARESYGQALNYASLPAERQVLQEKLAAL
jgi:RNA polymerase sigma-70 factor (ECF subfamily)